MAEKRTINIDINSNASEAEKDFKSFNKAVDETTKSAKNLDATFEEVYGELQPLTTRMGEAEDRLYELALVAPFNALPNFCVIVVAAPSTAKSVCI